MNILRHYRILPLLSLILGLHLSTNAAANDAHQISAAGQAWGEWATRAAPDDVTRRHAHEQADRPRAQERQERREAERNARNNGITRPLTAIDGMAGSVANALGWVVENGEDDLERISAELGARGYSRTQAAVNNIREALRRSGLIDPEDGESEPNIPDGNPGIPSSCEGNAACGQCYASAIDGLDNTRWRLEKLRAIYASTYRDAKAMISFADGASAVHGVSALAWQTRKIGLTKQLKNLDKVYDDKYAELMRQLHTDLQQYSDCESSVMRVPDWFDRFGFVYYQFLKDYYKRPKL